jgi:fatty-acyl-CoA synthase
LIALVAVLVRRPRRGVALAIVALLIPAIGLGYLYQLRSRSQDIPPIHDVATNPEDPPVHSPRLAAIRTAEGANPVYPLTTRLSAIEAYQTPRFADQADRTVGELGREANPRLRPLTVTADRAQLFAALEQEAKDRGWTIVTSDPAAGRLEATAETFWFGFKDDVAVRVRPAGEPGRFTVDARSTSRVGLSDLGANASRLTGYLEGVEDRLAAS